ncbi:unnamed protein product [Cuscuta campestris]|uniref:Homeobox domain-containing protein n=1 Tax=Cuscuta campestris TaxID=132261 RepID=A0A484LHR9_9ASTE|nr:unnamed protein product [Cuscuta campestris]
MDELSRRAQSWMSRAGLGLTTINGRPVGHQEEEGQEPPDKFKESQTDSAADGDYDDDDYELATSSSEEPHRGPGRRFALFASPVPLDLLPPAPVQYMTVGIRPAAGRPAPEEASSPNSVASSFRAVDFSVFKRNRAGAGMEENRGAGQMNGLDAAAHGGVTAVERASDDDENAANGRKKLRLSKEQAAFLEESFKEHHTLNPKQKHALAKQLNLRPRQVEVWFQNRRARTKLKQTEVDCEYLKKWCEKLREENKRLSKELQELRALKSSNPFHINHPPTTLTMCPSCEKVAAAADSGPAAVPFPANPSARLTFPFPVVAAPQTPGHQSAAS